MLKEMVFHGWLFSALLTLFVLWERRQADGAGYHSIVVDRNGRGDFTSINQAISSVPDGNKEWVCIYVKSGIYREKVTIPPGKQFVFLKGEGMKKSSIVWNDHASIAQSPTLAVGADNFVAQGISFQNAHNLPLAASGSPTTPAVAAMVNADKVAFYGCGFYGVQDTLWDVEGRHYFKGCLIQGAVDFIFGAGTSIYEECQISVVAGEVLGSGVAGYITAQSREGADDSNGFVFKNCKVVGNGKTYLGRPWRQYSTVIFYKTMLSNIVVPAGWDPWHYGGKLSNGITYAESGCFGLGANTAGRVSWEKQLSSEDLNHYTSMKYIDNEGWVDQHPAC